MMFDRYVRARLVVIGMGIGIASAAIATIGCHGHNVGQRDVAQEQEALLCHVLDAFRTYNLTVPAGGTVAAVRSYFESLGISDELNAAFAERGLDCKMLDRNELVLLVFSGIQERQENGEREWLSIDRIVHEPLFHFGLFTPDPRWVTDVDNDGWPEYTLPERKPIRFRTDSFDFPFSCSR